MGAIRITGRTDFYNVYVESVDRYTTVVCVVGLLE